MGEICFFVITVNKVGVTKKTCAEICIIEVAITKITPQRIDTHEVSVCDGRPAEVAVDHLAAGEDGVPACYIIEATPLKQAEVKEAGYKRTP